MSLLGDLIVKISLQGQEKLKEALGGVEASLKRIEGGVNAVGALFKAALFVEAAAKVQQFVHAGIQASSMGQLLNVEMERLSRTITGLFGPEIRKGIDALRDLSNWIDRLTPQQKQFAARMIEGAAAASAAAVAIPYLVTGFKALGTVLSLSSGWLGGLVAIAGAAASAMAALGAGAAIGTGGFGELWGALKPLLDNLSQIGSQLAQAFAPMLPVLTESLAVFFPLLEAVARLAAGLAETLAPVLEAVGELVNTVTILITAAVQGIAKLAAAIGGFIGQFAGFTAGWRQFNRELASMLGVKLPDLTPKRRDDDTRDAAVRRAGGFEAVDATFRRIAEASVRVGGGARTPEQQIAENTRQQVEEQKKTNKKLGDGKPVVVPGPA